MANTSRSSGLGFIWLRAISPLSWSLGLRRAFLITLPLSFPIYLVILVGLLAVIVVRSIIEPIADFWSAPQQKLRSGTYYGYDRRRKRKRITDFEEQVELPLGD